MLFRSTSSQEGDARPENESTLDDPETNNQEATHNEKPKSSTSFMSLLLPPPPPLEFLKELISPRIVGDIEEIIKETEDDASVSESEEEKNLDEPSEE